MEELALYAEHKWFAVYNGQLSKEEIYNEIMEMKQRRTRADAEHFGSQLLPENESYSLEAAEKARLYFSNAFGLGD